MRQKILKLLPLRLTTYDLRLFLLIFFFSFDSLAYNPRSTSFDDRPACEESKGVWRQFGNGCVDDCRSKFDEFMVCTQAIVSGCDCGKGRCWHEDSCVLLSQYQKIFEAEEEKEKKILDAAKKKRKEQFENHQKVMMGEFVKKYSGLNVGGQESGASGGAKVARGDNLSDFYKHYAEIEEKRIAADLAAKQQPAQNSKTEEDEKNLSLSTILLPDGSSIEDSPLTAEVPPAFLQKEKAQKEAAEKAKNDAANLQKTPEAQQNNSPATQQNQIGATREKTVRLNKSLVKDTTKPDPSTPPGLPEIPLPATN